MANNIIRFGKARFTVITENLVRCEYAENEKFCNNETLFAVCRKHNGCKFEFKENGNTLNIKTEAIDITYINDLLPFSKSNLFGKIFSKEWHFGKKNTANLGGTLSTLDGVDGYRDVDDGIMSKDGWFVIDDSNSTPMHDGWLSDDRIRRDTDIYLFGYGLDYKKALHTLFYVSGKPALPRKYVFGSWYSRWWAYTDEELLGIVDEYDENDFPLDIMVIDMDWHHHDWTYRGTDECKKHRARAGYGHATNLGWTGYSWNKRLIKDPPALLKKLHEKGIIVTLNDHPHDGVRTHEDAYPDFMENLGLPKDTNIDIEFDAGSKRYMDAFYKSVHSQFESDGVDFWWVDWQQDHLKPVIKGTKMKHIPWLNYCYYHHSESNGKRGISFSRWGGFGDHKHPIYFSGDTSSTWECLQFEVEFTAKSSNVGLFYWGHDTGGFCGAPDSEMYVRWTQFSTFSACLRAHSERNASLDRRPWKWGEKEADAMRKCYHLRSRLMPYIYSIAYRAYNDEIPMIEPMYYESPSEEEAYLYNGQYFFGNAFLCAPITAPMKDGVSTKTVWINDGVWYDFFTNKKYEKGVHDISCPLERFPLLVKGGIPIPMQKYTNRMTSTIPEELIISVFPGESGEFDLYEDDGISNEFKNGEYLKTNIKYKNSNSEITIDIAPTGNGYSGMLSERSYKIELLNTKSKLTCIHGNADVDFNNGKNIITIGKSDIYKRHTIVLK